jgi:ABC-type glycerol-3-phosphate transport system substrate-binding protein
VSSKRLSIALTLAVAAGLAGCGTAGASSGHEVTTLRYQGSVGR